MPEDGIMWQMWQSGHICGANATYVERLYEQYLINPDHVPESWRNYFNNINENDNNNRVNNKEISHQAIIDYFKTLGTSNKNRTLSHDYIYQQKQIAVLRLVSAYRIRGHQQANIDPLGYMQRAHFDDLNLSYHGLSTEDLDTEFQSSTLFINKDKATLREIDQAMRKAYCGSIGVEYMHIANTEERQWFQSIMESRAGDWGFDSKKSKHILERLVSAEGLENYLANKYPGTKRFGLEGGESLIPMVDECIAHSATYDTEEIVIGMAHRGRLNVLVNIFGKSPAELFDEFEGKKLFQGGSGDVKYHQGFSSNLKVNSKIMHLALAFNPSHLEIVSPVVEGSVRARQDRKGDNDQRNVVMPLVIHGDAAFAGQGVVMETFQMSQTRAYGTGGTIHIIVNNQIGFTTSACYDARSTEYCTDVAKIVGAPILHVNGDDPEAVTFAAKIAVDYRMKFRKDIVLDMICYRRRGHNEADEPSGTQPIMYQLIAEHKSVRTLYAEQKINEGLFSEAEVEKLINDYRNKLDEGKKVVTNLVEQDVHYPLAADWTPYIGRKWTAKHDTRVAVEILRDLGKKCCSLPEGFVLQRQVNKIIEDRVKMASGALPINWGGAEMLAYASLLMEGYGVRLTGQDVGRGTFSHRHAVLHDQKTGDRWVTLNHLSANQPKFQIYDSILSEEAVLAFEYGYATAMPTTLVIWEAQFGDFANGAQVVIDQFITSGEHKWGRLCGLTLLLPHGYEGQGPEHSSGRLERYLQLSAQHNIQVCVPTTPAQVFHMLRRQVLRPLRKPLIVFTPKSLLRHKEAVSTLDELADGRFQTILLDREYSKTEMNQVTKVILCSGKVYYDLHAKKMELSDEKTAILRIEQLYPFPQLEVEKLLENFENLEYLVWCQEEPKNQGAWYCTRHHFQEIVMRSTLDLQLFYAGREGSAASACGYASVHVKEQQELIERAFFIDIDNKTN